MDEKEIKDYVASVVEKTFADIEVSSKLAELDAVKKERDTLLIKLSEVQDATIPAEKVEEITEVVEKAVGDKIDSIVGEKLAEIVERVDDIENSMTNRQRIKKALSNKDSAFHALSRPSKAYMNVSDNDELAQELTTIIEKLKNAKDKQALEEVTNLLNAFVTSARKIKLSADDAAMEELEAYKELGSIEEIEAAIEVLDIYADEIGTLPELQDDEVIEEDYEEVTDDVIDDTIDDVTLDESDINIFSSKQKALASRKRKQALASKQKALANRRKALEATRKVNLSSNVRALRTMKRNQKLSNIQQKVKENMELSSQKKDAPGALASSLFDRKNV